MGKIYSTASPVYIWTGEETPRIGRMWKYFRDVWWVGRPSSSDELSTFAWRVLMCSPEEVLMGLRDVLSRDIWYRIWCLKEVLLSNNRQAATLVCVTSRVPYAMFIELMDLLSTSCSHQDFRRRALSTGKPGRSAFSLIDMLLKFTFRHRTSPLSPDYIYTMNRLLDAKDPHDHICGFFRLYGDAEVPDYRLPVGHVFALATVGLLRTTNLRMLLSRRGADFTPVSGAPSWVVNWQRPSPPVTTSLDGMGAFNASSSSPGLTTLQEGCLSVASHKIFDVCREELLGPLWHGNVRSGANSNQERRDLRMFYEFVRDRADLYQEGWPNVLWRCMLWDHLSTPFHFEPRSGDVDLGNRKDWLRTRAFATSGIQKAPFAKLHAPSLFWLSERGGIASPLEQEATCALFPATLPLVIRFTSWLAARYP